MGLAHDLPALPVCDFGEPDWEAIIQKAFLLWAIDGACKSLKSLDSDVDIKEPTKLEGSVKF
jgi:hypothetical protein